MTRHYLSYLGHMTFLQVFIMTMMGNIACDDQPSPENESNIQADMSDVIDLDEGMIELEDEEDPEPVDMELPADEMVPDEPEDPTDELYRLDRLLQVSITIDEVNWDELRTQSRSFIDLFGGRECLDQPFGSAGS